MNPLLNIIYLGTSLFFIIPKLDKLFPEPLYNKLVFVVVCIGLQSIFEFINRKFIKKEKKILSLIASVFERSIMKSLILLLGFLLFKDIKNSPSITQKIPIIGSLVNLEGGNIIFILLPTFIILTSKCLLTPY
jgi:hypothetical protein